MPLTIDDFRRFVTQRKRQVIFDHWYHCIHSYAFLCMKALRLILNEIGVVFNQYNRYPIQLNPEDFGAGKKHTHFRNLTLV